MKPSLITELTARDQAGIAALDLRLHVQFKAEAANALAAFQDALEELMESVAEDTIRSGTAIPGRGGCYDPDSYKRDRLCAKALQAAEAAFAAKPTPAVERRRASGLLIVHNPDQRLASRWSQPEGSIHGS